MLDWLLPLAHAEQDPCYHPEGDALFHSLQVFEHALADNPSAILLAAALFHDVGKAVSGPDHDRVGAEMLDGLPSATRWLVRHHLDLLRTPKQTKAMLYGTPELRALKQLRDWDLAGRSPTAWVREPEEAIAIVCEELAGAPNSLS